MRSPIFSLRAETISLVSALKNPPSVSCARSVLFVLSLHKRFTTQESGGALHAVSALILGAVRKCTGCTVCVYTYARAVSRRVEATRKRVRGMRCRISFPRHFSVAFGVKSDKEIKMAHRAIFVLYTVT